MFQKFRDNYLELLCPKYSFDSLGYFFLDTFGFISWYTDSRMFTFHLLSMPTIINATLKW